MDVVFERFPKARASSLAHKMGHEATGMEGWVMGWARS
jgi:hypothetical protein